MSIVVCGANSVKQKFYLDPAYDRLPEDVKNRLKIICVTFAEEFGGVLTLEFDDEVKPFFSHRTEGDICPDEIGSEYKIREIVKENGELLSQLALYTRIFVKGEVV